MGYVNASVTKIAAHMCKDELAVTAAALAVEAQAALAQHRDRGEAQITTSQGRLDSFVNLDDKAALSIEFGHWTDPGEAGTKKYVPGLHILGRLL